MTFPQKLRLIIISSLFLCALFVVYVSFREDRGGILTVAFLDVGQGDAIYIESPTGNQMLIDGGPGKAVLRELSKVMPFYDRSIDAVLESHADQDHAGGIPDVLKKYKADIFLESGVPGNSSSYEEAEKIISDEEAKGEVKKILARKGMEIDLGGGAIVQILFPDHDPTGMETNSASVIARLVYGQNEFLFTGDSPANMENYVASLEGHLLGPGQFEGALRSDVLKAGHHGSKTSNSAEFTAAVSPEYAVISVGKDNKYGHPNQETLGTLSQFGAKILRTDEQGRVVFKSDGVDLNIK